MKTELVSSKALSTKEANLQALVDKLMPYLQSARTSAGNFAQSNLGQHMLGGGALGAGLGGLAGLVNPGEDEEGNRRSRFGAMLRGALGGGALGAGAGGLVGHFAPNAISNTWNSARAKDIREMLGLQTDRQKLVAPSSATMSGSLPSGIENKVTTSKNSPDTSLVEANPVPSLNTPSVTNPNAGRDVQELRDATPFQGTTRLAGGAGASPQLTTNKTLPSFSASELRALSSPTYTPTAPGAGARRRGINAAEQASKDVITGAAARRALSGSANPGLLAKHRTGAQQQQDARDQAAGITNVSPELAKLKSENPAAFRKMMEDVLDQHVREQVQQSPSHGVDTTGVDFSNPTPFLSPTMGR